MLVTLASEPHDVLVVRLRDRDQVASVAVRPSRAGIESLRRTIEMLSSEPYAECFWPGAAGGMYWWMFNRTAETLEVIVMWTRGGAALWEHVFRASDEASLIQQRFRDALIAPQI